MNIYILLDLYFTYPVGVQSGCSPPIHRDGMAEKYIRGTRGRAATKATVR